MNTNLGLSVCWSNIPQVYDNQSEKITEIYFLRKKCRWFENGCERKECKIGSHIESCYDCDKWFWCIPTLWRHLIGAFLSRDDIVCMRMRVYGDEKLCCAFDDVIIPFYFFVSETMDNLTNDYLFWATVKKLCKVSKKWELWSILVTSFDN